MNMIYWTWHINICLLKNLLMWSPWMATSYVNDTIKSKPFIGEWNIAQIEISFRWKMTSEAKDEDDYMWNPTLQRRVIYVVTFAIRIVYFLIRILNITMCYQMATTCRLIIAQWSGLTDWLTHSLKGKNLRLDHPISPASYSQIFVTCNKWGSKNLHHITRTPYSLGHRGLMATELKGKLHDRYRV